MSVAIITGSAGLVGSEAAIYFAEQGMEIVGIDNDMRRYFLVMKLLRCGIEKDSKLKYQSIYIMILISVISE